MAVRAVICLASIQLMCATAGDDSLGHHDSPAVAEEVFEEWLKESGAHASNYSRCSLATMPHAARAFNSTCLTNRLDPGLDEWFGGKRKTQSALVVRDACYTWSGDRPHVHLLGKRDVDAAKRVSGACNPPVGKPEIKQADARTTSLATQATYHRVVLIHQVVETPFAYYHHLWEFVFPAVYTALAAERAWNGVLTSNLAGHERDGLDATANAELILRLDGLMSEFLDGHGMHVGAGHFIQLAEYDHEFGGVDAQIFDSPLMWLAGSKHGFDAKHRKHGNYRSPEEEITCGALVVVGAFDDVRAMKNPNQQCASLTGGNSCTDNVRWFPNVALAALSWRRALFKRHGRDPTLPTLGRHTLDMRKRPLRVLWLDRRHFNTGKCTERCLANLDELTNALRARSNGTVEVTVTDFKYGTPLADMWAVLERVDVLMAVEGSAFANQLFLPLNAGLFIIHGLKKNDGHVLQWHTPVAQYFGHSVVNYASKSPRIDVDSFWAAFRDLYNRLNDVARRRRPGGGFAQCLARDKSLIGKSDRPGCRTWLQDHCADAKWREAHAAWCELPDCMMDPQRANCPCTATP